MERRNNIRRVIDGGRTRDPNVGAQYLPSGITGLLNSTVPLWIAILALVIFRRHLYKLPVLGLCA